MKIKNIITTCLLLVLQNIAFSALIGEEGMTLLWHLDEIEHRPKALDATGNNYFGFSGSYGSTFGGARSPFKSGYNYFHTQSCYVACTNLSSNANLFRNKNFSFMMWAQSPDFENGPNITRLLARISNKTAAGGDVPWQLWVSSTNKAIHVSIQDWNAKTQVAISDSLVWDEDAWYMITMTTSYYVMNSVHNYEVNVYRSTFGIPDSTERVLSKTFSLANNANLAAGKILVIGACPNGTNTSNQPEGWWSSSIDEVSLWLDRILTHDEINSIFNSYKADTYNIKDIAQHYLSLDDKGTIAQPIDSINGIEFEVFGNVKNGKHSLFGSAYNGFTSDNSFIAYTNIFNGSFLDKKWATVFWVKNIDTTQGNNAILVRGAYARYGERSDTPFQVYFDENNYLHLGLLNGGAKGTNIVSQTPLELKEHTWYQVAVIHETLLSEKKGYNSEYMEVYFTEGGKDNVVSEPVIKHLFDLSNNRFAKGSTICYGGGPQGYYGTIGPAGFLGGELDEIYIFQDIIPSRFSLTENLQTCKPTATIIVIF